MEGRQYLKHGDLTKISKLCKVSPNFVFMVSRGERSNPNVESAIKSQVEVRRKELESIIECINES